MNREKVVCSEIKLTNGNTKFSICLPYIENSETKHLGNLFVTGTLKEYEIGYHISDFDGQTNDNVDLDVPHKYCSSIRHCFVELKFGNYECKLKNNKCINNQCSKYSDFIGGNCSFYGDTFAKFDKICSNTCNGRNRCDDIVMLGDKLYFFEIKNTKLPSECSYFMQLITSKVKISDGSYFNIVDINDINVISNTKKQYLLILWVAGYNIEKSTYYKNGLSNMAMVTHGVPVVPLGVVKKCRDENIIITSRPNIDLSRLSQNFSNILKNL